MIATSGICPPVARYATQKTRSVRNISFFMIKLCFLFFTALPARAVRALPVTACDILGRSIPLVTLVLWARLASFWEPPTPIRGWRCFLTLGERLSPPTPILSTPTRGASLWVSTSLTYPIGTWVGVIYLWGII